MRVDLYTSIHKAQRYHLFHLSEDMGRTDFGDDAAASAIAERTLSLMERLKDHARSEETYIHPLFRSIGAVGGQLDEGHERLEREIRTIERVVEGKLWPELYPVYTRFLGLYLLHLDEEETAQRDALWRRFDDARLAEVFNRFKAERPSHLARADLEFMLPAMSVPELIRMFSGMKASAPASAYQGACEIASRVLPEEDWRRVVLAPEAPSRSMAARSPRG